MIDEKLKDDTSDVDDYPGKWAVFVMINDGQSGLGNLRYNHKKDAEEFISGVWKGEKLLRGKQGFIIPIEKISMLIALPAKD